VITNNPASLLKRAREYVEFSRSTLGLRDAK
jgi:hypothetical protein